MSSRAEEEFLNAVVLCRGRAYVDGSLSDFLFWENSKLLTLDGRSFVLDYSRDVDLKFGRLDFVKLRSYESVMELMAQGRRCTFSTVECL